MNKEKVITLSKLKSAIQKSVNELENQYPDSRVDHAGIKPYTEGVSEHNRYESTPSNTTLFAWTGGDGVHFSLLKISEILQPVVMTVPTRLGDSANDYNWILGENLNEFLSIGYYNGWFGLENLCYKLESTIEFYNQEISHKGYYFEIDNLFIERMRTNLNYQHIPITIERLRTLKEMYFDKLTFKNSFIEMFPRNK